VHFLLDLRNIFVEQLSRGLYFSNRVLFRIYLPMLNSIYESLDFCSRVELILLQLRFQAGEQVLSNHFHVLETLFAFFQLGLSTCTIKFL
jgi:hypothetical protein